MHHGDIRIFKSEIQRSNKMKIGLISDTHGYMDDRILHHLADCDLVWHAGDVGNNQVIDALENAKNTQGVFGNIDGTEIRTRWPEFVFEEIEGVKFLMVHIAGAIERYNEKTRALISKYQPDVLVCGHSHILKVKRDQRFKLMHMNPGAVGNHGFHKVRTFLKLDVENGKMANLQAVELGPRSSKSFD
jgi:putative phosphoesterase